MGVNIDNSSGGAGLIAMERQRQQMEEGFGQSHDADHDCDELICAAMAYLEYAICPGHPTGVPKIWPWEREWWKPKDRKRNLIRAGALIAAELDRMG